MTEKLLFLSILATGISWILIIPIWQYPDEQAHFSQVQNTAEGNFVNSALNSSKEIELTEKILGTERNAIGNNKYTYNPNYIPSYNSNFYGIFENFLKSLEISSRKTLVRTDGTTNPPLYYILGSLFYKTAYYGSILDRVFMVRIYSLIIFLSLIIVAKKIAKVLFRENKLQQLTMVSMIAFMPMLMFASTGVLPDALTNFLFSQIILLCLLLIKNGLKLKYILYLVFLTILGKFTRQQFLIAVPITIAAIVTSIAANNSKIRAKTLFILSGVIFLVFIMNRFTDFGILNLPEIGKPNLFLIFSKSYFEYWLNTLNTIYHETFPWYWGVFKWLSLALPFLLYRAIKFIIIISIAGYIYWIIKIRNKNKNKQGTYLFFLALASLIYTLVLYTWDYYHKQVHGFSFGIQGRYFFPVITAHLALLFFGITVIVNNFLKKYSDLLLKIIIVLMVAFNDYTLFFVASHYYHLNSVNIFIQEASQYKPEILKGLNSIIILAGMFIIQLIFILKIFKNHRNLSIIK